VRSLRRRPESRWENNIIVYVREFGCGNLDWIHLAKCRNLWRTLAYIIIIIIKFFVPHIWYISCLDRSACASKRILYFKELDVLSYVPPNVEGRIRQHGQVREESKCIHRKFIHNFMYFVIDHAINFYT
jgi:hypothetical protein